MKSEHVIALIALILGIIGGLLLCKGAIDILIQILGGNWPINIGSPVLIGIGIIAIIASATLWTGRYLAGGVINIVLGLITIFYGVDAEGIMILLSGVLGIVAPKIKD
ncbi:MAG: hypothetical protein PVH12_07130 [Candidatus Bathyarchaeota archaeon]|jgi:hypothetical protein